MGNCRVCKSWLLRRENHYENGEVIVKWKGPDGKGKCGVLDVLTAPNFGCIAFEKGGPLIKIRNKTGEPWHHKHYGPCPDCKRPECGYPDCSWVHCPGMDKCQGSPARASGGYDDRCVGTGLVYYYDDGFIGENRTKMHPKEKMIGKKRPDDGVMDHPPECRKCNKSVSEEWNVCPYCGYKLKEGSDIINIDDNVAVLGSNE